MRLSKTDKLLNKVLTMCLNNPTKWFFSSELGVNPAYLICLVNDGLLETRFDEKTGRRQYRWKQ